MKICESCSRCPSCSGPDVWTWALERANEAERKVAELRAALTEALGAWWRAAADADPHAPWLNLVARRITELKKLVTP